ncbi:transposase [Desulfosporosinus metallidurans]|uniref:Transposase n=1 Tax=Desulfosporosinus metallidurans TaxID=1888891 RepID=A0A1Q8R1F4_9FIRM|nr:transposase [Desulfosporosinus metallidurans]OLN33270.1 transposase [Desulfosporosinus metallidurans]
MPRKAREKSQSGIYHVILRGANRQEIFHEDEDSLRFLEIVDKNAKISEMKVFGWCLMGNHVHLLLGEGVEELSVTMKRIGVSFAWYYNWKYKTTGHLFQDRFRSENVENDGYLLTVIRYIHQNPVKAGMVKLAEDWKWSSCHNYYSKTPYSLVLLDRDLILTMFSTDRPRAIAMFKEFSEVESDSNCIDDEQRSRMTDEDAELEITKKIAGIEIAQVKSLPKRQRDEVLRKVKKIEGVTHRQAARIFGVSPNLIFKA